MSYKEVRPEKRDLFEVATFRGLTSEYPHNQLDKVRPQKVGTFSKGSAF